MSRTIERLKEHKARRVGYYRDLIRESGACESSGREFSDGDVKALFGVAAELNLSERTVADDLAASCRFHGLTEQLATAEDQKSATEKTIAKLNDQIKQAVGDRNAANDARTSARHRRDTDATRGAEQAYTRATGEISRLQNEIKQVRRPLAACEVLPKQIGDLVGLRPWLKGPNNGN